MHFFIEFFSICSFSLVYSLHADFFSKTGGCLRKAFASLVFYLYFADADEDIVYSSIFATVLIILFTVSSTLLLSLMASYTGRLLPA